MKLWACEAIDNCPRSKKIYNECVFKYDFDEDHWKKEHGTPVEEVIISCKNRNDVSYYYKMRRCK